MKIRLFEDSCSTLFLDEDELRGHEVPVDLVMSFRTANEAMLKAEQALKTYFKEKGFVIE